MNFSRVLAEEWEGNYCPPGHRQSAGRVNLYNNYEAFLRATDSFSTHGYCLPLSVLGTDFLPRVYQVQRTQPGDVCITTVHRAPEGTCVTL